MKKKYALFGKSISYSLSPIVHKAIGEYYDVDLEYEIRDCENITQVTEYLNSGEYDGANVTMPYKVNLIDEMDEISPTVKQCGALNTIKIENSNLIAYNTDSMGFSDVFDINDYDLKDKRVLVYGTGGAARAIVNSLLDADVKTILSEGRRPESKVNLFRTFEKKSKEKMSLIYGLHGIICDLVINATMLGSKSSPELSIDIEQLDTSAVFDVVYDPVDTELIKLAREEKKEVFLGIEMLICQAIRSFYIWNPEFYREDIHIKLFNYVRDALKANLDVNFKE